MSEQMEFDLDPKKVLDSINQIGKGVKDLAKDVEDSLGKDASRSFKKFEETTENGSAKIASIFRDLKNRVKEDLKTAFDVGAVMSGAKLANDLAAGTRQVFEMERAFDKLNTRLMLSGKALMNFKREVGGKVAGTGQKLEDVLPGVESVASRGGVKSPDQLADIAEVIGQAKAITGEDTTGLAESIVEILKNQGRTVNSSTFKSTMDAVMGTRTAGAFASGAEAAHAIEALSPYGKSLGLNTRELGGLAAAAGGAGSAGQGILQQLLSQGTTIGGQQQINAAFGTQLFKNGSLDTKAFGNIKKDQFGQYSKQIMSEVSGITGANGADLSRFIDAMKNGGKSMERVTSKSEETADQFEVATNNLASKVDKFKASVKEGSRQVGDALSHFMNNLLNGKLSGVGGIGTALNNNAGPLAAALGISLGVGAISGGAFKRLFGKGAGALGGLTQGVAEGEVARAAGIQPVYVTNFSEFPGSGGGIWDKLGAAGVGAATLGAGAAAAAAVGFGLGTAVNHLMGGQPVDYSSTPRTAAGQETAPTVVDPQTFGKDAGAEMAKHFVEAFTKTRPLTNPSKVQGTGGIK